MSELKRVEWVREEIPGAERRRVDPDQLHKQNGHFCGHFVCDIFGENLPVPQYTENKVLPYGWSALISGLLDLNIDLSGLNKESPPKNDAKLEETKYMVRQLKNILNRYWKCMG